MDKAKRIFLIGYMGSGKTTVGKKLAEDMNLQFVDLDYFIECRYRKTVGRIFEEDGEVFFRNIEHKILEEITNFEDVVIATGGGVPCFHNNMDLMNASGTTVYLKVSVEELAARLEQCKQTRPLLRDKNTDELKSYIVESLNRREHFYSRAKIIFDAENVLTQTDVDNIVVNLIKRLS